MNILNELSSKIFWALLVVALLVGGYIFFVKNLVKPPQLATTNTQPTKSTPAKDNAGLPSKSIAQSPATDTNISGEVQPAIAQPEGVIINAPKQLEKGGVLKIYANPDENPYPDPLSSSLVKKIKTDGVEMIPLEDDAKQFQEVEGYFLAPQTQNYNFVVSLPEDYEYAEVSGLRVKIDGLALDSPSGGKAFLEKGYHKLSFFNNYSTIDGYPTIDWAAEGKEIKPLNIFREVETENN